MKNTKKTTTEEVSAPLAKQDVYRYKPVKFFVVTYIFTWLFWGIAIYLGSIGNEGPVFMGSMLLGLLVPAGTSFFMIMLSGNRALKADYKRKLIRMKDINLIWVIMPIAVMGLIITVSILLSLLFGESPDQFSLVGGFSFSVGSVPTLLTLILAALLEELGWRGYAEDSIAGGRIWFKASLIFASAWAVWHFPLFFIPGTYQNEILLMNPIYAVSFFIGTIPMGIVFTWVYIKNNRSIFACVIFHFFVNFLQEQIAMTQVTKCIETFVVIVAAAVIVLTNKGVFFSRKHIGNLLGK